MGAFVAYDLDDVFANREGNPQSTSLSEEYLLIPKDPFLDTQAYTNYEEYRILERTMETVLENDAKVSEDFLQQLQTKNTAYWKSHYLAGRYYFEQKQYHKALAAFKISETKEITTVPDQENLAKYIKKAKRKSKR
jgi:hypothetical protein